MIRGRLASLIRLPALFFLLVSLLLQGSEAYGHIRTYSLPSSVTHYACDAEGQAPARAVDETADLQTWINSIRDGSPSTGWHSLVFPAGRCIRMDGHLSINNRHYLVFEGRGVTLDQHRKPSNRRFNGSGTWGVLRSSFLQWRSFKVLGNHPEKTYTYPRVLTKVSTYGWCRVRDHEGLPSCEWQAGWGLLGSQHILLEDNETKNTSGDSVAISWDYPNQTVDARYITINNHRIYGAGRQGISAMSGQDLTISNSYIEGAAHHAIDLEPESETNLFPIGRVTITNNVFGQSHMTIAVLGTGTCTAVTDITFTYNRQIEPNISGLPGLYAGRPKGCSRPRGPITVSNNDLWVEEWGNEGDVAAHFVGYSGVTFSSNSIKRSCGPPGCYEPNEAAVHLDGGVGHVVSNNNLAVGGYQPWPWVYAYDGWIHHSLGNRVSSCGNATAQGTDRPTAC